MTIQIKVIEQYFPVVLFTMMYKVALTFESVGEIPKRDHSIESYRAVLSYDAVPLYSSHEFARSWQNRN